MPSCDRGEKARAPGAPIRDDAQDEVVRLANLLEDHGYRVLAVKLRFCGEMALRVEPPAKPKG